MKISQKMVQDIDDNGQPNGSPTMVTNAAIAVEHYSRYTENSAISPRTRVVMAALIAEQALQHIRQAYTAEAATADLSRLAFEISLFQARIKAANAELENTREIATN